MERPLVARQGNMRQHGINELRYADPRHKRMCVHRERFAAGFSWAGVRRLGDSLRNGLAGAGGRDSRQTALCSESPLSLGQFAGETGD